MAGQDTISPFHEAARAWAAAGFAVFPCTPGAKTPATANGLHDASTDPDQIDRWWTANPAYNIGVSPAHHTAMYVLDVDPPLGAETLRRLEAEHGALPPTLAIRTPRGGLHYWFTGSCPSSVAKLGPKLDTRGRGGYVLVPPSIVNGVEYTYENEIEEIAAGPAWLAAALDEAREAHIAPEHIVLDDPANIARAIALLDQYAAAGHVAVEGQGGDNRTYQVCAEILNLGLSQEAALEVIRGHWNPHCVPPWDAGDLATKLVNAAEYAQNEQGAWAVPPAEELFAHVVRFSDAKTRHIPSKFYPRDEAEQDTRSPPTWLIPDLIPEEGTVLMYGPEGNYKSFMGLDLSLTLASGRPGYGAPKRPRMDVVYIAAEGSRGIERLRRPAWRLHHGIQEPLPFYVIDTMPIFAVQHEVVELMEAIRARAIAPKLLVIDTLNRAMTGANENDVKDASNFIAAIEFLKRELRCTILVIHHTGKDEDRGARGHSAISAAFDTKIEVKTRLETKAVALHVRKQKDADLPPVPWTFEGVQVDMGGGQKPGLVFVPIDTDTHRKLTKGEDAFAPQKIGAALRELRAIGEAAAISTHVLASHMVPPLQSDAPEDMARAVARCVRQLHTLARTRLEAYTTGEGRTLRWFLMPSDEI